MTDLSMDATQAQQATELSSKIISVYELLMDSALDIPQYQRPYKWTGKNINQLFSDIAIHKDKSAYRLGTIVFHQEGETKNIVDGQQRTISLLLAARAYRDSGELPPGASDPDTFMGARAGSFLFAPDAPLEQAYQAQLEKAVRWTAQPEERA